MGFRVFWESPPAALSGAVAELAEAEAHHLTRVRRASVGAPIELFDGHGGEWRGTLAAIGKRTATVALTSAWRVPPPACPVTLAICPPQGTEAMEWLVEKAAELGAAALWPVVSERTGWRPEPARVAGKLARWTQIAREACKQCGGSYVPQIAPPLAWTDFLRQAKVTHPLVAALLPGAVEVAEAVAQPGAIGATSGVVVLIGPEGDLSPAEYSAAQAAGFRPVTLGPLVLRAETAAIAALTLVQAALRARPLPL